MKGIIAARNPCSHATSLATAASGWPSGQPAVYCATASAPRCGNAVSLEATSATAPPSTSNDTPDCPGGSAAWRSSTWLTAVLTPRVGTTRESTCDAAANALRLVVQRAAETDEQPASANIVSR